MTGEDTYDGYSLTGVTWGYRDIFSKTIQRLFDEGYLGPEREEITRQFFSLLRCSEAGLYDHVLKSFLDSLTGDSAWIFDLPVIFGDIVRTGSEFAEAKMFYGIEFYRHLKDGGFGDSPEKVQFLLAWITRLKNIDMELSFAFLQGYQTMLERLRISEINYFVEEGIRIFAKNTQTGLRFMRCKLGSCEAYFRELTSECRFEDIDASLERLLRALTGRRILAAPYDGAGMICEPHSTGFPVSIRRSASRDDNHRWYLLSAICAAAHYNCGSQTDADERDVGRRNLTAIIEHQRTLAYVAEHWPGARALLRRGIEEELPVKKDDDGPDGFFALVARTTLGARSALGMRLSRPLRLDIEAALKLFPAFGRRELKPVSFLPDLYYRAAVDTDPDVSGEASVDDGEVQTSANAEEALVADQGDFESHPGETVEAEHRIPFLYDEWSNEDGAYHRGYCSLYEERLLTPGEYAIPASALEQVSKVRRVFEMLKPAVIKKIKRLNEGDEINPDLLVQYLVDAKVDPSPKVNFYERPLVDRRDLSVLVLLDVSGSTDEEVDGGRILDIEKQAAIILGQGLAGLGDAFSLCGFSSNGRENCRYFVFKDFSEEWGDSAIASLYAAVPSSSTRIGVALRHAGRQLQKQSTRQRLIILITDGRPMDQAYDPETRYAQHDVRMACEENRKSDVFTFCVSTMENSRADMEIMFPEKRFVILNSISELPKVLPQLYIRLTT